MMKFLIFGDDNLIGKSGIDESEKDKLWYGLIDNLFSEETNDYGEYIVDIEEIAASGSYLSINFFALDEKIRNTLVERLNQINESQLMRFFEVIEYLFEDEDDRETEIILLLQLLQLVPSVGAQALHILEEGNLTPSWKNIAALVAGLMYEENFSDFEEDIDDL